MSVEYLNDYLGNRQFSKMDNLYHWFLETGSYVKGIKEGTWIYENGKLNGSCYKFYKNEKIVESEKGEYINGKRRGNFIFWENGQKSYEGEFKDGKKHGPSKIFYKNGDIGEGIFENGKKKGKWLYYYKTGEIHRNNFYQDDYCEQKEYYLNGKIRRDEKYQEFNSIFKINGYARAWHENGNYAGEENYKEGVKNGLFKYFNCDGSIFKEGNFKDGIYDGIWKEWKDGKIFEIYYREGKIVIEGEKIIGDDVYGANFAEYYYKCSCKQKTHYFTEESSKKDNKYICPFDMTSFSENIYCGCEEIGILNVENSEIL